MKYLNNNGYIDIPCPEFSLKAPDFFFIKAHTLPSPSDSFELAEEID